MKKSLGFMALIGIGLFAQSAQAEVLAIKNFRSLLASYSVITGVDSSAQSVQDSYQRVIGRLPVKGTVEEINSPMLLALVELSGAYCKEMLSSESTKMPAERRVFGSVNFGKGPTQFNAGLKSQVFTDLATMFWGRTPQGNELMALTQTFDEFVKDAPNTGSETSKALQNTCAQLGTSMQFLVN